tara:strand:+ start:175 stop:534 length:360 start_codon:yes stop_codon:yes gene_type:complete
MMLNIKGGKKFERTIAEKTVSWCVQKLGLSRIRTLEIRVLIEPVPDDCYGYCENTEGDNRSFKIAITNKQNLRYFVMTLVHEMIHVKQYVRNKYDGDGEEEAWELQEAMTDEIWKENIL